MGYLITQVKAIGDDSTPKVDIKKLLKLSDRN